MAHIGTREKKTKETERHTDMDRETLKRPGGTAWCSFGALVGVLRDLSCSKSRYFPQRPPGLLLPHPHASSPSLPSPRRRVPWVSDQGRELKASGCQLSLPGHPAHPGLLLVPGPSPQSTGEPSHAQGPAATPTSVPHLPLQGSSVVSGARPSGPVGVSMGPRRVR